MTVLLALDSLLVAIKAAACVRQGRTRTALVRAIVYRAQRELPPLRQGRHLVLFAQVKLMIFRQGTSGMLLRAAFPALVTRTRAAPARASVSRARHLVHAPPERCPLQMEPAVRNLRGILLRKDARFWLLKGALCVCHPVRAPLAGLLPQTGLDAWCPE